MSHTNKRVQGSIKNKVVASELLEERAKCNFDQKEMKSVMMPDENANQIISRVNYDTINDPELGYTVSHKFYDMTVEEKQVMWMKKLNYLWNKDRDFYFNKGFSQSYFWYWAHFGQPAFGMHATMFKNSIETFCDEE